MTRSSTNVTANTGSTRRRRSLAALVLACAVVLLSIAGPITAIAQDAVPATPAVAVDDAAPAPLDSPVEAVATEPMVVAEPAQEQVAEPTPEPSPADPLPTPTPIPDPPSPTPAPSPVPTGVVAPTPTAVVTPAPIVERRTALVAPASVDAGSGAITGCAVNGSDLLQPGGIVTATCTFERFGSHQAVFSFGSLTSGVPGATTGWSIQLSAGGSSSGWATSGTTFIAPEKVTTFTVSLRAPSSGGMPGSTVASTVQVQMCSSPDKNCSTGTTTISARLAAFDPGRVTMTCGTASPVEIARLQEGMVTCTIGMPSDAGATRVDLRAITLSAVPAGWSMATSPAGTVSAGGEVTLAPGRALASGESWSFSVTLAPSCDAASTAEIAISSQIAVIDAGNLGAALAGPSATIGVTATAAAGAFAVSVVDSALAWDLPASFDDQAAEGSLSYQVTAAGCGGWTVTAEASPFTYVGPAPSGSVGSLPVTLTGVGDPVPASGTSGGAVAVAPGGRLDTPQVVLESGAGSPGATYEQELRVAVTVPGGAPAGSYSATITITASSAP